MLMTLIFASVPLLFPSPSGIPFSSGGSASGAAPKVQIQKTDREEPTTQAESTKGQFELELEALDGSLRRIRAGRPVLEDPRQEQAWLIRVLPNSDSLRAGAGQGDNAKAAASLVARARVTLVGGDQLLGDILAGQDDALTLRIAGGARLPLTIDDLRSVVVASNLPTDLASPIGAPVEGDRVYRRTGNSLDRDDGAVLGFTSEGVLFESQVLGERLIVWDELAALFVEALGEPETPVNHPRVGVVADLVDGSRLRGRFERLDAENLVLGIGRASQSEATAATASTAATVAIPLAQLELVTVDDGRLAFLSSMTPSEEIGQGSPFGDEIGLVFGHVMDHAVTGTDLFVNGRRYARGIGTHAPTRLQFELPEGWTELRAKVGVDDSTARLGRDARGSVRFRVKWNGEILWESPVVRGGMEAVNMPPLKLPATTPASGASGRLLELEADPVEDFRGDRANWLEVLLVRG